MYKDIDLSYAIGLPPRDAIHYFESKGRKITFNWQEMWQEAYARAFTVVGVAKTDLLADIQAHTARAIAQGRTGTMFADDLIPVLKEKGWWGKKDVVNPKTGEVRQVMQGSPARVNLIYRQNVQSAYNAGRYKQQRENAVNAPYWRYVSIKDQKTRPSHGLLHGKVFHCDDPFWTSHYPPNGWGCRCRVDAMTKARLARRGDTLESSEGRMVTREVQLSNPRPGAYQGEVQRRTVTGYNLDGRPGGRVAFTDVGFSYNAGATFQRDLLAHMPTPPQGAGTDWQKLGLSSMRHMPDAEKLPAPPSLPKAATREEAAQQVAHALGFAQGQNLRVVQTPMGKRTLWRYLIPHTVEKEADARERFANYILPTLTSPHEIWLIMHKDGKLRENYIALFEEEKYGLLAVVRINADGSLLYNFMQRKPKDMDKLREGWLAWHKKN